MTQPMTIALAIGDPNGIGPEIAVKAAARLADAAGQDVPRVVLFGDAFVIRWYGERCASGVALREVDPDALPVAVSRTEIGRAHV